MFSTRPPVPLRVSNLRKHDKLLTGSYPTVPTCKRRPKEQDGFIDEHRCRTWYFVEHGIGPRAARFPLLSARARAYGARIHDIDDCRQPGRFGAWRIRSRGWPMGHAAALRTLPSKGCSEDSEVTCTIYGRRRLGLDACAADSCHARSGRRTRPEFIPRCARTGEDRTRRMTRPLLGSPLALLNQEILPRNPEKLVARQVNRLRSSR